jgi:galactose mutarotase-like enzyme
MIYEIFNENTRVKINSLGAEVRSVIHKGVERTWQNEGGQWAGCAILLFPFAGFNRMVYGGCDYGVKKHGFCRNEEFTLVSQADSEIEFSLSANERTKAVYPYDFTFNVKYTLTDEGYEISYIVKNPSEVTIPFASGGHESFKIDSDLHDYYIEFERDEKFDFLIHNDGGFLTGEKYHFGDGKILRLEDEFTDNSKTVILGNINSRKATLRRYDNHERVVEIDFEGYSNLLIWHPHGSKMVCIEPWQCLPSYEGEVKEFAERDGVVCLSAGSEITLTRAIKY